MARRRLQQKGDLQQSGGVWWLRWHEDKIQPDGSVKRGWSSRVAVGLVKDMTKRQARAAAWENHLSKVSVAAPQAALTVRQFVESRFLPEHVAMLKTGGRVHYDQMLPFVLAAIGNRPLGAVSTADVQALILQMQTLEYCAVPAREGRAAVMRHYSPQTIRHVRNVASAIFSHAIRHGLVDRNPALLVRLPAMTRRPAHALTFDDARKLLAELKPPAREMALCIMFTSMNVAELMGLCWRHVNLTDAPVIVDAEVLPPRAIAVRQQWRLAEYTTLKGGSRRRNIPMISVVAETLAEMKSRLKFTGPGDPVFSARTGRPLDDDNYLKRHLHPAAARAGLPAVGWHDLRRTHATLCAELGMLDFDRVAGMGHADLRMTMLYTRPNLDRRRELLEQLADRIR